MTHLTQKELNKLLDYDPVSGELTWKERPPSMFSSNRDHRIWNTRYSGKPAFTAKTKKGYNVGAIHNTLYRAHRLIYLMMTGKDPDQVDHIDGNPSNNSWTNLREVSSRQNQLNMKKAANNTSGTTGVVWNAAKSTWDARITVKGKQIFLGRSACIQEAIALRKEAEKKYGFHPNHGR